MDYAAKYGAADIALALRVSEPCCSWISKCDSGFINNGQPD